MDRIGWSGRRSAWLYSSGFVVICAFMIIRHCIMPAKRAKRFCLFLLWMIQNGRAAGSLVDRRKRYGLRCMRYFAERLIDHDEAANCGGWQWCASTGTDAQPYFRIFNPVSQGEKFDAEGAYVKRYIPELLHVPPKYIHKPWQMPEHVQQESGCIIGLDYPPPCVDHATSRLMAIERFSRAKRLAK